MRFRRFLDQQHAEGVEDGRLGRRPNPGRTEYEGRRGRWAYDAGWAEGRRDFEAMRQAMAEAES